MLNICGLGYRHCGILRANLITACGAAKKKKKRYFKKMKSSFKKKWWFDIHQNYKTS